MTKINFMLRDALSRYTSFVGSADTFPSEGKAHCRVLFCRQRFYDCVVTYPFFFLRRKKNRLALTQSDNLCQKSGSDGRAICESSSPPSSVRRGIPGEFRGTTKGRCRDTMLLTEKKKKRCRRLKEFAWESRPGSVCGKKIAGKVKNLL